MDDWVDFQRRHFNERSSEYTVMYGGASPFQDAMTRRLLFLAGPREGEEVLEIGCGVGRLTIPLLRAGVRLTGLDISPSLLRVLQDKVAELDRADRFSPLCLSAEQIDFENRFQLVIGRGILHHLKDPVEVLARVRRALLPGGRAVFMDPNPLNPGWIPLHVFHPALSLSVERYLLRGTPARTRRMFARAGFQDVQCVFAGLVPPPFWGHIARLDELEQWLASIPLFRKLALYLLIRGRKSEE